MYKEIEKKNALLTKQLSTNNYEHSLSLNEIHEEVMKLRSEKEELMIVNKDSDLIKEELKASQNINNIIITILSKISKINPPSIENIINNHDGNYYISSSSSSSSSPMSKILSPQQHHQSSHKSEFESSIQSIHRMITNIIDNNHNKQPLPSSSLSSSSTSNFIIPSSPISSSPQSTNSINTLLYSLILFLEDLSSRFISYQQHFHELVSDHKRHSHTLEQQINSYREEVMDVDINIDRCNQQIRSSGFIIHDNDDGDNADCILDSRGNYDKNDGRSNNHNGSNISSPILNNRNTGTINNNNSSGGDSGSRRSSSPSRVKVARFAVSDDDNTGGGELMINMCEVVMMNMLIKVIVIVIVTWCHCDVEG